MMCLSVNRKEAKQEESRAKLFFREAVFFLLAIQWDMGTEF